MIFFPPGFFCHRPTHVTAGSAVILLIRFTARRYFCLFAGIVDVLKAKYGQQQQKKKSQSLWSVASPGRLCLLWINSLIITHHRGKPGHYIIRSIF